MDKSKILIIDDDVDILESTKAFLESTNYEVSIAINSKNGLEIFKTFHPDLIILDVMMDTDLEGFNFLNYLKSDENLMKTPIIINTSMGKAMGVNLRTAVEDIDKLLITRFVDKSEDWNELLKVIKELL